MRAVGPMKSRPRIFPVIRGSVEDWMSDQAWLVRLEELVGTEDGTPLEAEAVYGPYAAKLSQPTSEQERQPDRTTQTDTRELAIASDVKPQTADKIHVQREGVTYFICHVTGTVEPRLAAWGEIPLYHVTTHEYEEM
jgi:hypothetical protein